MGYIRGVRDRTSRSFIPHRFLSIGTQNATKILKLTLFFTEVHRALWSLEISIFTTFFIEGLTISDHLTIIPHLLRKRFN
jgi:hypothetical protein